MRDAETILVAPQVKVRVTSLIDLIRIAEASPDLDARVHVPALWATLRARRPYEDQGHAA